MASVTPVWTDSTVVLAPQVLARGSTVRGTLDLRAKFGAFLHLEMGRGGTTALTNGVDILVRQLWDGDSAATHSPTQPAGMPALLSSIVAATSTTVDADSNAAQATLNVTSTTGFAAGDIICIQDAGGGVTRLEFHRVSKITNPGASGELVLDRNLVFTHTGAQADTVRNKSDVFAPIWMPGGSYYEVIFDYGDDSAGESVTLSALAQTWDSDSVV
jgi:hypothetical protein